MLMCNSCTLRPGPTVDIVREHHRPTSMLPSSGIRLWPFSLSGFHHLSLARSDFRYSCRRVLIPVTSLSHPISRRSWAAQQILHLRDDPLRHGVSAVRWGTPPAGVQACFVQRQTACAAISTQGEMMPRLGARGAALANNVLAAVGYAMQSACLASLNPLYNCSCSFLASSPLVQPGLHLWQNVWRPASSTNAVAPNTRACMPPGLLSLLQCAAPKSCRWRLPSPRSPMPAKS